MAEIPTGTVTFLFTDIEGSTRLLKQLRERYGEVLDAHQRILREAVEEHGGTEIDSQGDSFFFAFHSALDAVAAADAAQRALAAHEWPQDGQIRVRIGLHTGEPVAAGDRYLGLGVHRAARISAAGHGGQVLLSNTTRELVEDDLPPSVTLRDLGEYRLKDIDRPERIFQLELKGLFSNFPPLKTLEADTPFAGREAELEAAAGAAIPRRPLLTRRILLLAASVGAIAVAVGLSIFTLGRDSELDAPVAGTWESVDRDGSHQTIKMNRAAERGTYDLTLKDDDAREACGGGAVTGNGPVTVAGGELSGEIVLHCVSGATLEVPVQWTYREADDKLVDIAGVVWSRVKAAGNG